MQFCEECGSMMHAEDGAMVCTNCGASVEREGSGEFTTVAAQSTDDVIETEEGTDFEGKPTATDVTCEECGNGEAWYTIKQTASADEPPTRFFKCTECGYRWREYN